MDTFGGRRRRKASRVVAFSGPAGSSYHVMFNGARRSAIFTAISPLSMACVSIITAIFGPTASRTAAESS